MSGMLRNLWNILRNSDSDSEEPVKSRLEEAARNADEERRAVQRFAGPVPATVSASLSSFPESVTMRDLNEKGVYVYSAAPFPRGATLEIVTELPSELSSYGKRRVHYTASVVRCEENAEEGKYGIAAVIKKCEVLPARAPSEQTATAAAAQSQNPSGSRPGKEADVSHKLQMKDSAHVGD